MKCALVRICLLVPLLSSLGGVRIAVAAPPREQTHACVAASTQGQTDRDEGRLLAAREQFLSCTREVCPQIVKKSCAGWLAELSERIPSVVVRVHEASQQAGQRDVTEARVTLDGSAVTLDGRSLTLDPGRHTLSVDAPGFSPVERTFLVAEREQGRLLIVELPARSVPPAVVPAQAAVAPLSAAPKASAGALAVAPVEQTAVGPRRLEPKRRAAPHFAVPIAGWVLGGLGVASVVSFVALRSKAHSDLKMLERTCSPTCSDEQRDEGKRKALAADISLGIGFAAFAAAGAWTLGSWLTHRSEAKAAAPRTARLSLVPARGGALATLAVRY